MPQTSLPQERTPNPTTPLRRLLIAEVLDCALRLYRTNFRTFVVAVTSVLMTMTLLRAMFGRDTLGEVDWQQISPLRSDVLLSAIVLLRTPIDPIAFITLFGTNLLLYVIARVLLTSILVHAVAQSYLGPYGVSVPSRTRGLGREIAIIPAVLLLLPLDLQTALVARGMRLAASLSAAWLQATTPSFTSTLDVALLFGRGLLAILLIVLLSARFLLAPQAVMLERSSAFASLARSWRLSSGWFWRIVVVMLATSALIGLLLGLPNALVRLLLALSGSSSSSGALTFVAALATQLLEALALPFQVAVFTVLFYDIRIRKEGFDLDILTQQVTQAEVQPLFERAWQKLQHHDPQAALIDLEQALRIKPNDANLIGLRAYAQAALPDLASALASGERAVALEPHNPFALNARGYVKQASGDMAGALADYRRTVAIQPGYQLALAQFADAKLQAGDTAGALANLEQLLQLTPNDARASYNAACLYAVQGQPENALHWLQQAIKLQPTWRATAIADPDFAALRADPRFIELTAEP